MKAIEETAAHELLDALRRICILLEITELSVKTTFKDDYSKAIEAIKQAQGE